VHAHENLAFPGNRLVDVFHSETVGIKADCPHDPSLPHAGEEATAAGGEVAVLLAQAVEERSLLEPAPSPQV